MSPARGAALIASCLALLGGCAAPGTRQAQGTAPGYLESTTDDVPNAAALGPRIWTPGLDAGFVPQGLASAGRYLFVSSYHPSPDLHASTGPCRVFRIELASGRAAGAFDLPEGECTHAGGLASLRDGTLLLADTHRLFRIDIERALATGTAAGAMKSFALAGALRGSFATFDGRDLWIGTWTKDASRARMYRLSPRLFDEYDGRSVSETLALESIPIPPECQGATVAADGDFWVSASNGRWGRLYRIARGGEVKASYEMPAGLEDLTFDESGRLWGLSESGTRKYLYWPTKYPFVFVINTSALR